MICVSIARGRHRHVIAEHRHLVEQGAKLIELRVDFIRGPVNLQRLMADRPSPVIITCRRERDGGRYTGSEEDRLMLLRTAIASGAEYVDLEEDIAGDIPRFGKTQRIVSLHDFRKTPADLEKTHARMTTLDPDIVKIATLANHPGDNQRMLELMRASKVPTAGICMGDIGTPTRILGGRFGAPFTYATFHHERTLAPGQLTYQQMREIYRYEQINAETEVYGVLGDPIGHSHSPLIHNAAFDHLGLNKVYLPFRVPPEDLARFIDDAPSLGIRGLSVTIPHKEMVLEKLDKLDSDVVQVDAANTLVFTEAGIEGHNTDYRAAMESLETAMGGMRNGDSPVKGFTGLILGAGGVAQAIAHGLKVRGAEVFLANRNLERAETLAEKVGGRALEWEKRHSAAADILINCTPLGMHPNVDATPYEKHMLKPSMVVFDTVYNPERTMLVRDARERSCTVVTGVEMFIRQAALQFSLFTGQAAPADVMRDVFKRATSAAQLG